MNKYKIITYDWEANMRQVWTKIFCKLLNIKGWWQRLTPAVTLSCLPELRCVGRWWSDVDRHVDHQPSTTSFKYSFEKLGHLGHLKNWAFGPFGKLGHLKKRASFRTPESHTHPLIYLIYPSRYLECEYVNRKK
jgi:hypothetical protein